MGTDLTTFLLIVIAASITVGFYRTLNLIERIANTQKETARLVFNEIKRRREKDQDYGPMV